MNLSELKEEYQNLIKELQNPEAKSKLLCFWRGCAPRVLEERIMQPQCLLWETAESESFSKTGTINT
jgi:hypothetical protein